MLVRCPTCLRKVSTEASACPGCGQPITTEVVEKAKQLAARVSEKMAAEEAQRVQKVEAGKRGCLLVFLLIMVLVAAMMMINAYYNPSE